MFDNFRDKFQTVQNDLSLSLRGLSISPEAKDEVRNKLGISLRHNKNKVILNAGSDLLQRYSNQWQQMHQLNEENAKLASEVAKSINHIDSKSKKQYSAVSQLLSQLSILPQIEQTIGLIEKDLNQTKKQFLQIEQILTHLESAKEEEDFEKLKLDHKYKLNVYKESKAMEFEANKVKLANEHRNRVHEYERYQQNVLKERQKAFQAVFEDELNLYKTEGKLVRKDDTKVLNIDKTSIEEIVIETEKSDELAFEQFLEDIP